MMITDFEPIILHVKPGDVVIFRVPRTTTRQGMQELYDHWRLSSDTPCIIVTQDVEPIVVMQDELPPPRPCEPTMNLLEEETKGWFDK